MGFSYSNKLFGGTGSGGVSIAGTGSLTAGRVVLSDSATGITDDAGLAYNRTTDTLAVALGTVTAANVTAAALATPGAITVTPVLTQIGSITTPAAAVRATGLLTAVAKANLIDGETFTLNDGANTTVFEFDVTGDGVGGGNVAVDVSAAGVVTATDVATVCANVMGATVGVTFLFNITDNLDGTVTIQNAQFGTVGNTVSAETVADAGFILTNMTGGAAGVADGDTFTVDDGTDSVTFEFDFFGVVTPGNTLVALVEGDTADNVRDKIVIAVNTEALDCTAIAGGAGVVSLSRNTPGATGGLISEAVVNAGFTVSTWANPTAATTVTYKLVARLASGATTEAGAASSTAASVATLTGTNFIRLSWSAVTGATDYQVYRTVAPTSPATTGVIYTGALLTFDDTGIAGSGATAPTSNGTGVVTGARVAAGDGTLSAPGFAFAAQSGTGFLRSGSSQVDLALNESLRHRWTATGYSISAATGTIGISSDLILSRPAAATLQLGAAAANADGFDQTIQTQGGITGTDRAAGDLTIQTGVGTGTGASSIIFKAPTPQATGTTAQTHATVLTLKDAGTGGTSAPQALFADGTAAAPSVAFASSTDMGLYRGSAAQMRFAVGGGEALRLAAGYVGVPDASALSNASVNSFIGLGAYAGAVATIQLGAAASATPVAQTLQAQGGSGTDIAGANLTIQSGAGTGAATGSLIEFKTPNVTTSGTAAQSQSARLRLGATLSYFFGNVSIAATDTSSFGRSNELWQSLFLSRAILGSKSKAQSADATATDIFTIPLADGAMTAGEIIYRVTASAAGQKQVISGRVRYSAVRDNVTYDCDVSEVGTQTTSVTSGALTGAWTCTAAAGVLTFAANFDSSLDVIPTVYYRIDSTDTLAITPL